jgi:hypothetical protein
MMEQKLIAAMISTRPFNSVSANVKLWYCSRRSTSKRRVRRCFSSALSQDACSGPSVSMNRPNRARGHGDVLGVFRRDSESAGSGSVQDNAFEHAPGFGAGQAGDRRAVGTPDGYGARKLAKEEFVWGLVEGVSLSITSLGTASLAEYFRGPERPPISHNGPVLAGMPGKPGSVSLSHTGQSVPDSASGARPHRRARLTPLFG